MAKTLEAGAYSFADCQLSVTGPNGLNFTSSGEAEEGYTVAFEGDKVSMTVGAGGAVMHSVRVAQPGTLTLRLLQTSTANKLLSDNYNASTGSAVNAAAMQMVIDDFARGDHIEMLACSHRKHADIGFATQGGIREWVFNVSYISPRLGAGVEQILTA